MRNYTSLPVLAASIFVLFGSCKLTSDNKDVVVKVDPEFLLGVREELGQVRDFNLTFQTLENQTCKDNLISFTSSKNKKKLFLAINEIVETPNCQVGEGLAEGAASFDFLPIGTYDLELFLKNTINTTGTLLVTNDQYILNVEDGFGFQVLEATLMRVPSATIWGYVAFKDSQALPDANNFLEELSEKTENLQLSRGNYGYFQVGDNDKLSLTQAPDYNNFKTFYRISSGQIADLEALLADFRSQYPPGQMEFKIYTWQGETL